jgi:hypothetical protein
MYTAHKCKRQTSKTIAGIELAISAMERPSSTAQPLRASRSAIKEVKSRMTRCGSYRMYGRDKEFLQNFSGKSRREATTWLAGLDWSII